MKHVLLISYYLPSTRHAGGLRLLDLYSEIRRIQPDIYLVLVTVDQANIAPSSKKNLHDIFNEIHFLNENEFVPERVSAIEYDASDFDVVDLQYHQSGRFIPFIRSNWPTAVILFSPMESQVRAFLITLSSGFRNILRSWRLLPAQFRYSIVEIYYVFRADRVVSVSDADKNFLTYFKSVHEVISLPTCLSAKEFDNLSLVHGFTQQGVVVFFAYFGSRTNQDALAWFLREVHPVVKSVVPFYQLRVVGHGMTEQVLALCDDNNVDCVGAVETVLDAIKGASIGIAPALGGAGIRGKIHQYAAAGIPCIASPNACKSLAYSDGVSILVAGSAKEFATACILLLQKTELRNQLGLNARAICKSKYLLSAQQKQITATYNIG